jgi:S-DNA-T family DNA segregation ATPase FtsK/SpoIIIE
VASPRGFHRADAVRSPRRSPTAVVEAIKATDEDGDYDAMCQVILTHRDRARLAELYQKIASQEGDDDAFHVSESSREFMARVRINIMVNGVPVSDQRNGQPTDIVFCQDVISRRAALTYPEVTRATGHTLLPKVLRPTQWSRRKELRKGDKESVVFLTCPAQTALGWQYLLVYLSSKPLSSPSHHGRPASVRYRRSNWILTEKRPARSFSKPMPSATGS